MNRQFSYLFAGAAFAICASASAAAYAQAVTAPPGEHQEIRIVREAGERHMDMAQHLRNVLQLRPAQEPALAAFVGGMHPPHDMMLRAGDADEPKTTPERLDRMEKAMAEHQARMREQIAATRRFYDQLDPGQRRAFDELHMGDEPMGMMRHVRFMHGMAPMPGMPPHPPMPPAPPVPPGS